MSTTRPDTRSTLDGLLLLALGTVTVVTVLAAITLSWTEVFGW